MGEANRDPGGLLERWQRAGQRLRALHPARYYRYMYMLEARIAEDAELREGRGVVRFPRNHRDV